MFSSLYSVKTCNRRILPGIRRNGAARLAIVTQSATRCCKNAQSGRALRKVAQERACRQPSAGPCKGPAPARAGRREGFLRPVPDAVAVGDVLLGVLEQPPPEELKDEK